MPDINRKDENVELNPEGSPHPEMEKEHDMLIEQIRKEKPGLDKPARDIPVIPLVLDRGKDGQLQIHKDGVTTKVKVSKCFPWTQPGRFISLRDKDDAEVALISDLKELDIPSRLVLEQAMAEAGFILEVEQVHYQEEEFEIRVWKVQTKQGPRTFQTKLDEWPRTLPGGGLLIRDVAGDLYYIPRPREMDVDSKKHLWAFMDE
jgi:hypothetical protein